MRKVSGVRPRGILLFAALMLFSAHLFSSAPHGVLDTSFATDGTLVLEIAGEDHGYDVAVQTDGKVVVVGQFDGHIGVLRLNNDGSPDATFGGDGQIGLGSEPLT